MARTCDEFYGKWFQTFIFGALLLGIVNILLMFFAPASWGPNRSSTGISVSDWIAVGSMVLLIILALSYPACLALAKIREHMRF